MPTSRYQSGRSSKPVSSRNFRVSDYPRTWFAPSPQERRRESHSRGARSAEFLSDIYLGQPGQAAYAATKGGLVSTARAIAADFAPRNIRVVAPGAKKTPIWKRGLRASVSAEDSTKLEKFFSSAVPLGTMGQARRTRESRALPYLRGFLVRQRSRTHGGWRRCRFSELQSFADRIRIRHWS